MEQSLILISILLFLLAVVSFFLGVSANKLKIIKMKLDESDGLRYGIEIDNHDLREKLDRINKFYQEDKEAEAENAKALIKINGLVRVK